jgi:hypothetical protein
MIQAMYSGALEHVISSALRAFVSSVLFDDWHRVDQFQLEVGITHGLAQRGQRGANVSLE